MLIRGLNFLLIIYSRTQISAYKSNFNTLVLSYNFASECANSININYNSKTSLIFAILNPFSTTNLDSKLFGLIIGFVWLK